MLATGWHPGPPGRREWWPNAGAGERRGRAGLEPARVTIAGVVDTPPASSRFQKAGAPPQSQPSAPPDNVILLPEATFNTVMGQGASAANFELTTQIHVARDAPTSGDPAAA